MKRLKLLLICLSLANFQSIQGFAIGFSGMEQIDQDSYLVVLDKKVYEDGDRIGILKIQKEAEPIFSPLRITDWKHDDGQASDLESVCRIPETDNEFLLAEAGYWEGKYGRIFHVVLSDGEASVKNVFRIPKIVGSADGIDGENFEGIVCFKNGESILVVLGERGGSSLYQNGFLRIGLLNLSEPELSWNKYSSNPVEIAAPGNWNNTLSKRSISDLYLDKHGVIWAVATEDPGDEGPFKSTIYKAAVVSAENKENPVVPIHTKKAYWTIDGFKIEALAAPSNLIKGSYMSIGTEDELYNGAWRSLFYPVE